MNRLVMANNSTVIDLAHYQGIELIETKNGCILGARRTIPLQTELGADLVEDVQFFAYFLEGGWTDCTAKEQAVKVLREIAGFWGADPEKLIKPCLDVGGSCSPATDEVRKKLGISDQADETTKKDYKPSVYKLRLRGDGNNQKELLELARMKGERVKSIDVSGEMIAIHTGED